MKGNPTAFDLRLSAFLTRVFYRTAHPIAGSQLQKPANRIRPFTDFRIGSVIECEPDRRPCPSHTKDKAVGVKRMFLGGR